jgi:phosphate-selective porin
VVVLVQLSMRPAAETTGGSKKGADHPQTAFQRARVNERRSGLERLWRHGAFANQSAHQAEMKVAS